MDELTQYLKLKEYNKLKLEKILNKKIIITKDHINNINAISCCIFMINIIKLFEKYGYVFTNDDYIMLVSKCGLILEYIFEDKKTDEICKIAVQKNGYALSYVPEDKKTDEICKIAVRGNGYALNFIPSNKKRFIHKK